MTRYATIGTLAIGLAAAAALGAWAVAATPPLGLEGSDGALTPGSLQSSDRPAVAIAAQSGPTGNPLWGIPLRVLTATRERPLFSPSRRPPAPPAVASPVVPRPVAPPKPAEPEHPQVTIVGTIVGGGDAIAVFIDQATKNVIRLHPGQDHNGWVLRSVQGREATFEKNDRMSTLALPAPGILPAGPTLAGTGQPMPAPVPVVFPAVGQTVPVATPAAVQAGNTWMDGDGNLITPPTPIPTTGSTN